MKPDTIPYFTSVTTPCYATIMHAKLRKPEKTPHYTIMVMPCYTTTSSITSPYYVTMTSLHHAPSQYSQLEHYSTPTIAPVKRSTSDNYLAVYKKIRPQHNSDKINTYSNNISLICIQIGLHHM